MHVVACGTIFRVAWARTVDCTLAGKMALAYYLLIALALGGVARSCPLSLYSRERELASNLRSQAQPTGYSYQTKYFTQKVSTTDGYQKSGKSPVTPLFTGYIGLVGGAFPAEVGRRLTRLVYCEIMYSTYSLYCDMGSTLFAAGWPIM